MANLLILGVAQLRVVPPPVDDPVFSNKGRQRLRRAGVVRPETRVGIAVSVCVLVDLWMLGKGGQSSQSHTIVVIPLTKDIHADRLGVVSLLAKSFIILTFTN
jgi:hypothetical protein